MSTLGPRPREVLDVIAERASWHVLGNHDEYMSKPELLALHSDAPVVVSAVDWCRAELDTPRLDRMARFVSEVVIDLGGAELWLFHGSPVSNHQDVLAETPAAELDVILGARQTTVMAGGHTHVQMIRQHGGRLLVNPGSVGMPFERFAKGGPPVVMPHAEYAIVEAERGQVGVMLRRVELDRDALIEQVQDWKEPIGSYLKAQYLA